MSVGRSVAKPLTFWEGSEIMLSLFLSVVKNPKAISYIAVFLAGLSLGWYVHSRIAESTLKSALASQQAALIKQCEDSKKITMEVSREYQSKITALNGRVAALRLRPAKCVPVTKPATGHNGEASGNEPARPHGVDAGFLIDYAGEAEKYRLQLISCQDFVRKERQ
jgi:hypothetical protein